MEDIIMDDFTQFDIVRELKDGNRDALEKAINHYSNKLLRTAYSYIKDEDQARDIVQKVFIKAYYRIDMFKGNSSFYTWLYRITINECKQRLRKWSYRNIFYRDNLADISDNSRNNDLNFNSISMNTEEIVLENEARDEVYQTIMDLDLKYRSVIILYYYNDFSIKEIAEILEEKEATIKTRLFRARNILKEKLTAKGRDFGV